MLRSFHYIDEKGKDQGINGNVSQTLKRSPRLHFFFCFAVRNRAKELVELLADVDKIRQERKKAKANRSKYVGTGNDGLSFGSGRYGGFGSESYGGGYSGEYGVNASGYDRGAFLASSSCSHHQHPDQNIRGVGAVADSAITRRGEPTLRSTMLATMRLRPAAQLPPRRAKPVHRRHSPKLRARHRSPSPHRL